MSGDSRPGYREWAEASCVSAWEFELAAVDDSSQRGQSTKSSTRRDLVMRVLGFTLLHEAPGLLEALQRADGCDVDVPALLESIVAWQAATPRLFEARGGQCLDCAALVRVML